MLSITGSPEYFSWNTMQFANNCTILITPGAVKLQTLLLWIRIVIRSSRFYSSHVTSVINSLVSCDNFCSSLSVVSYSFRNEVIPTSGRPVAQNKIYLYYEHSNNKASSCISDVCEHRGINQWCGWHSRSKLKSQFFSPAHGQRMSYFIR